jgi:hypothetical protein
MLGCDVVVGAEAALPGASIVKNIEGPLTIF